MPARVTEKVWGREYEIVNNEKYCGKILEVDVGGCSSLHYHPVKDETFYVLEGACYLEMQWNDKTVLQKLWKGEKMRIHPGTAHRFYCDPSNAEMAQGCKILEISTPHSDDDVVRLEQSKCLS